MKMSWIMLAASAAVLACSTIAVEAAGIDLPARKPGQWEIKITPKTAGAAPTLTTQLCLDAATDKAIMARGLAMSPAAQPSSRATAAATWYSTRPAISAAARQRRTASSAATSSRTTRLTSSPTAKAAIPPCPSTRKCKQQATWVGACPAGIKPGDMLLPGGRKVNFLD